VEICDDDAQSLDEASEISDEDDGAPLRMERSSTMDAILQQCRALQSFSTGSLESIHDSGMDSIMQDSGMDSMSTCRTERKASMDQSTQTFYAPPLHIVRNSVSRLCYSPAICGMELNKHNTTTTLTKESIIEKFGKHSHIPLSTRYLGGTKYKILPSCKPPNPNSTYLPQTILFPAKNTKLSQIDELKSCFVLCEENLKTVAACPTVGIHDNQSAQGCIIKANQSEASIIESQSETVFEDQSDSSHQPALLSSEPSSCKIMLKAAAVEPSTSHTEANVSSIQGMDTVASVV
jgi:hypothetical protein